MTDTSADDSEDEQSWARLRDETTRADVYCHEDHKQEWQEEAEHNGQSLSRYLYDLIEEARGYREGGLPLLESKDERSVSRNLNPGSKSYRMNSIKLEPNGKPELDLPLMIWSKKSSPINAKRSTRS